MPVNRLYTQLSELPVVEAGDVTVAEDGLFCNVNSVDSFIPFDELSDLVVPAGLEARVTTAESEIDTLQDGVLFLTPQMYGAIADGVSHPLSSIYGTLAAAQVDYPFATALTQEVDYVACKKMSNAALGADAAENGDALAKLNRPMFLPAGSYIFGNDTWLIRNVSGMKLWGAGKRATKIYSNVTVLAFDGLWYSELADFTLETQSAAATVALDIDGNVPGHPYVTRGVQANTFRNILIVGGMSDYAVAMCRLGGSGGQGSENLFVNCHFQSAAVALYYQNGFNALNNTILGGNFQVYNKYGIWLVAGQVSIISVGFQSTVGYTQIVNDGYDIRCADAGVNDEILVIGCRTESLRFYKGGNAQIANIQSINGTPSIPSSWPGAGQVLALDYVMYTTSTDGRGRMYRVTTAGTTGGVEPVWAPSGTVADNTVVWTVTEFDWINITKGRVDRRTCITMAGRIINSDYYTVKETAVDYTVQPHIKMVLVDTSAGNRIITLPEGDEDIEKDRIVTIKKNTADANTVFIAGPDFVDYTIPGGSKGAVMFQHAGGGAFAQRWWVVGNY